MRLKKRNVNGLILLISVIVLSSFSLLFFKQLSDSEYSKKMEKNYKIFSLVLPDSLTFSSERVPMHRPYVYERMDYEFLKNTYWHSQTIIAIKRANKYFPIIEPILKKNDIPDDFKYLAVIESNLDPIAVSPARAKGMWQFISDTGKEYGLEISKTVDERYHVEKETQAACDYLSDAKEKFGSWTLAAVAYNAGMNGIEKRLYEQQIDDFYDLHHYEEPTRYVFRIIALKYIMTNPERFGFYLRDKDKYTKVKTHKELVDYPIVNLAEWARQRGINYKVLKVYNPWLISAQLDNPSGKTYFINIPVQGIHSNQYFGSPE